MADEKPKKSAEAELTQVTTQTAPAYKLPNGEIVGFDAFQIDMYNKILKIEKAVA